MIPNFIVKKLFINLSKFLFLSIIFLFIFNQVKSDEKYDKGKIIFLEQGNCAACHTLSDAGSDGNIGPNLNEIRPDVQRILMAVKNGVGVMPAMEGLLSNEEIEAVAHYVSVSADQ
jgi:mono/diheme cytochrome c family protein